MNLVKGRSLEDQTWVYGYYLKRVDTSLDEVDHIIIPEQAYYPCNTFFSYSVVDLDSVKRFSGFRDVNEQMIYEGDQCLIRDDSVCRFFTDDVSGIVTYDEDDGIWCMDVSAVMDCDGLNDLLCEFNNLEVMK